MDWFLTCDDYAMQKLYASVCHMISVQCNGSMPLRSNRQGPEPMTLDKNDKTFLMCLG